MKKFLVVLIYLCFAHAFASPKPMESLTHYNVIFAHGAYESKKGFTCSDNLLEAANDTVYQGKDANIGHYDSGHRLNNWLDESVFENLVYDVSDTIMNDSVRNRFSSYIYHWRSFTNPANSSVNNAFELGDRTWNECGNRRALVEEAQEVKAKFVVDTSLTYIGQAALDSIRKNPFLYRALPSRYILIGHSMGGVVSREYVQNSNYYYNDVDKIITLDSPHEGTGALDMQLALQDLLHNAKLGITGSGATAAAAVGLLLTTTGGTANMVAGGLLGIAYPLVSLSLKFGAGYLTSLTLDNEYKAEDDLVFLFARYPPLTGLKILQN